MGAGRGCSPEEGLEILGQLCAASVAGVHGDEDAHRRVQANLLPKEVELLLLISNCILNAFYLVNKPMEKWVPWVSVRGGRESWGPTHKTDTCVVTLSLKDRHTACTPGLY